MPNDPGEGRCLQRATLSIHMPREFAMKKLLVIDDDLIDAGFVLRAFSDVARDFEVVHVVDADVA